MKEVSRVRGGCYPTPLYKLENISKNCGVNIYVKREDLNGVALGGNKVRKLDYFIADALEKGCNAIITFGAVQTNHGCQTVAMARKYGLKPYLLLDDSQGISKQGGNITLDKMMGAEIFYTDTSKYSNLPYEEILSNVQKELDDTAEKIQMKTSEKVYVVPAGGSGGVGIFGSYDIMNESFNQLENMNIKLDYIVAGIGSGGTLSGIILANHEKKYGAKVLPIAVSNKVAQQQRKYIIDHVNEAIDNFEINVPYITEKDVNIDYDYVYKGYNIPDKDTRDSIYKLAKAEGLFTDPCYSGKIFSGLFGKINKEEIKKGSNVLILHSGGIPGLFSNEHILAIEEDFKE